MSHPTAILSQRNMSGREESLDDGWGFLEVVKRAESGNSLRAWMDPVDGLKRMSRRCQLLQHTRKLKHCRPLRSL